MPYQLHSTVASSLKDLPGLVFKKEENNATIEVQEYQPNQSYGDISCFAKK